MLIMKPLYAGRASKGPVRASDRAGNTTEGFGVPLREVGGPQRELRGPQRERGGPHRELGGPRMELGGPWKRGEGGIREKIEITENIWWCYTITYRSLYLTGPVPKNLKQ